MRNLICAAAVVFVSIHFAACSKSSPTQSESDSIYGQWTWQFSIGGMTGNDTLNPARIGFTKRISLSHDGLFKEARNDSLYGTSRFTITRERTMFGSDSLQLVHFEDSVRFPAQVLWTVNQERLELGDTHTEPYGHLYARITN